MSQNQGSGYGQNPPDQPYGYPPQQSATPQYGQSATPSYGQPPQQPATPQYGQPATPSYGQPPQAQPYGQPAQAYGQPPSQPYGYPTQQTPTQPYGQPAQGLAQAPVDAYGAATAPRRKSPALGVIALAVVAISGFLLTLYMYRIGIVAGPYAINGTLSTEQQPQLVQDVMSQMGRTLPLLGTTSIFTGLVGWILGIVATATNRGRGFGVVTIILGVLAPIVAFVALFVALAPYMQPS